MKERLEKQLRITEIFHSLQGETRTVGIPTVFVRLTGCPLRCQYCDTAYAFSGGKTILIEDILSQVESYNCTHVTVSGGEPLAQPACLTLLTQLSDVGYVVSLETSGAMSIAEVDPRVVKVLDVKTPGSKESERNLFENFEHLNPQDQVKFVICDNADYDWAKALINEYQLDSLCEILFSPSYEQMLAKDLADKILADKLNVSFQIQLHKYIWGDTPGT